MKINKQGLTLVEVVVALLLFSVVVIFTLPVFISANRLNNQAELSHNAQDLGQEVMELVLQRVGTVSKESYFKDPQDIYREDFFASLNNPNPSKSVLDGFVKVHDPELLSQYQGSSLMEQWIHRKHDYQVIVESLFQIPGCDDTFDASCFTSEIAVYVYQNDTLLYQARDWFVYEE